MEDDKRIKIYIVPQYMERDELEKIGILPNATVEAEYGERVIEGTDVTLAHHAEKYKNNPAPCNNPNVPVLEDNSIIIISHLDLDTLGGISALMGIKQNDSVFWKDAEFIDMNGSHHLHEVDEVSRERYKAFRAYQSEHPLPKFIETTDITDTVLEYIDVFSKIMDGDKELIDNGEKWFNERNEKIENSLVYENANVRVFYSDGNYCSSAYCSPNLGIEVSTIVMLNKSTGEITVSIADGCQKDISAKEFVREHLGKEAGGHDAIAGGSRGEVYSFQDLIDIGKKLNVRMNELRGTNVPFDYDPDKEIKNKEDDKPVD